MIWQKKVNATPMLHSQKTELINLLYEFKRMLPPVEERESLTWHYAKVEKRIDEAIHSLKDKDYHYIQKVNSKLLDLQLEGRITMDQLLDFSQVMPD